MFDHLKKNDSNLHTKMGVTFRNLLCPIRFMKEGKGGEPFYGNVHECFKTNCNDKE